MSIYIRVYICICSVYKYVCMLDCVHVCVECMWHVYCMCASVFMSVRLHFAAIRTFGEDPDPLQEI